MPLRTGNTYVIPGRGVVNTKRKTFSGSGKVGGTRKVKAPTLAETPTVISSRGRVISTSGFPSPHAARIARKQASSSQRRVRRIQRQRASALGFHRRVQQRASQASPQAPKPSARLTSLGASRRQPRQSSSAVPSFKPPKFQGAKTAGTPTLSSLRQAQSKGLLRTNRKGYVTTPAVRKVAGTLKHLGTKARRSNVPLPGLTPAASHVAHVVLRQGQKAGATRKEKLAAAETGLVESHFENLSGGTSDSAGWRQERAMYYPNPTNVKASASRYFKETAAAGRGRGETAGTLAQSVQRSAYPERYDEVKPEANAILRASEREGLKPAQQRKLVLAKRRALNLGLTVGKQAGPKKVVTVPGRGRYVFPFPANKGWSWSRTDMGTDFAYSKEGAPIRALGSGVITKTGAPGWPGEGGVLLKLDHAKGLPSPYIFVYEGVVPTVSAGQRVKRGQLVARGGITGSIEIGFADSNGEALAHSEYTEGMVTKYGQASTNLLHMVESGKTRIPVGLLSVGGTLMPNSGGTVVGPSGAAEATLAPSSERKTMKPQRQRRPLTQAQSAHRTLKRLKEVGAGISQKPSEASSDKGAILAELERRYGAKAA